MSAAVELYDAALVDAPACIPPGQYEAVYLHHQTAFIFNSAKVFVHFRITDGDYTGMKLYRAYRVKKLRGKPRKGGSFELGHTHELYRQFVRLTQAKERPDRLSLRRLKNCVLQIRVRTVKKDSKQRELPDALQYSVVDSIESLLAGSLQ